VLFSENKYDDDDICFHLIMLEMVLVLLMVLMVVVMMYE